MNIRSPRSYIVTARSAWAIAVPLLFSAHLVACAATQDRPSGEEAAAFEDPVIESPEQGTASSSLTTIKSCSEGFNSCNQSCARAVRYCENAHRTDCDALADACYANCGANLNQCIDCRNLPHQCYLD